MKRMIAVALSLTLVSGCATMDDRQTTQAQGAGFGAIAGAVIGGIIGEVAKDDAGAGALIGGLVGGAAGAAYGTHVANKKAEYARNEDYLDACVAQASKVRGETEAFNVALQQELDALDKRSAELLAAIEAGKSRQEELNVLRVQGKTRLADAEKAMEKLNVELELQRQVLEEERKANPAGEQLAKLQEQVQALEAQRDQLQQRTQRLASINNRMSV